MASDVQDDPARAASASGYVAERRDEIDARLAELVVETEPADLYEPVRYVLAGGGKRLRPILLLLSAGIAGAREADAMPAALSVEVFHNFTLVHDDIMDHADERRGRETVHVRWDESTAILTGDYLLALAYDLLSRTECGDLRKILRAYHRMVTRLCEGQTLDKVYERRQSVSVEEYFSMIYAKTGALIECCFEVGGLIGDASSADVERLRSIGRHIGRAFQVQDDLLDLTASDERWGKSIGGDLIEGKKAYLLLRALERAEGDDRAWFMRIVERPGLDPALIPEARQRMEALGVLDDAAAVVESHSNAALEELRSLPASQHSETLAWLVRSLMERGH